MSNSLQVCVQILSQNTTDLIEGFGFDIKKDNQIELSIAKCQIQFNIYFLSKNKNVLLQKMSDRNKVHNISAMGIQTQDG